MIKNHIKNELIILNKNTEEEYLHVPKLIFLLNNETIQKSFGLENSSITQMTEDVDSIHLSVDFYFKNDEQMAQFKQRDIDFIVSLIQYTEDNNLLLISSDISYLLGELENHISSLSLQYVLEKDTRQNVSNTSYIKKF